MSNFFQMVKDWLPVRQLVILFVMALATPLVADEQWSIRRLIGIGDKLPDNPELTVQEIGTTVFAPPDMTVAWVRVADAGTPNAWMLISVKQGKVRSIIREGDASVSKYAAANAQPMKIIYQSKWIGVTRLYPANGRLYVSWDKLHVWDGESFRKVIVPGDQVRAGQTSWKVASRAITVVGTYDDGGALIQFGASAPRKVAMLAMYDGTSFTPLVIDGEDLPGMPGVKMNANLYNLPLFGLAPGGATAKIRVSGAPYSFGLFRIWPDRTELITAYGKGQKTFDAISQASSASGAEVFASSSGFGKGYHLYMRHKGQVKDITPPLDKPGRVRFLPGRFLRDEPPLYLFASSRATTETFVEVTTKEKQTVFDSFWLVGEEGTLGELPQPAMTEVASGFAPLFHRIDSPSGFIITKTLDSVPIHGRLFFPDGGKAIEKPPTVIDLFPGIIGLTGPNRAIANVDGTLVDLTREQ